MAKQVLTVEVECRLTVSKDTTETCLKMVEMFINANKGFGIHDMENDDGTVTFYLVNYGDEREL